MFSGLYAAASAVAGAEQQQEAIAQNLAHLNVPGYRRVVTSFVTSGEDEQAEQDATVGSALQMSIDFSPGPYTQTGRSLDASVHGDGFFVVDSPDGPLYTRDGVMRIVDGRLVNNAGFPFQGASAIPPGVAPADLVIDNRGRISHQGQSLGQLNIARFADNSRLLTAGPSAFAAPDDMPAEAAPEAQIQQGVRELANVNATQQLVQMLVGMRYQEAAQQAMRSLSDAMQQNTTDN